MRRPISWRVGTCSLRCVSTILEHKTRVRRWPLHCLRMSLGSLLCSSMLAVMNYCWMTPFSSLSVFARWEAQSSFRLERASGTPGPSLPRCDRFPKERWPLSTLVLSSAPTARRNACPGGRGTLPTGTGPSSPPPFVANSTSTRTISPSERTVLLVPPVSFLEQDQGGLNGQVSRILQHTGESRGVGPHLSRA